MQVRSESLCGGGTHPSHSQSGRVNASAQRISLPGFCVWHSSFSQQQPSGRVNVSGQRISLPGF